MPRILGIDIPNDKKVTFALTYIKGIGLTSAEHIVEALQINTSLRAQELTEDDLSKIASMIDQDYVVEGELNRLVSDNIKRLNDIGSYRGQRHRRSLPARGQRTRTNARTRKGPARAASGVSVRKAVAKK